MVEELGVVIPGGEISEDPMPTATETGDEAEIESVTTVAVDDETLEVRIDVQSLGDEVAVHVDFSGVHVVIPIVPPDSGAPAGGDPTDNIVPGWSGRALNDCQYGETEGERLERGQQGCYPGCFAACSAPAVCHEHICTHFANRADFDRCVARNSESWESSTVHNWCVADCSEVVARLDQARRGLPVFADEERQAESDALYFGAEAVLQAVGSPEAYVVALPQLRLSGNCDTIAQATPSSCGDSFFPSDKPGIYGFMQCLDPPCSNGRFSEADEMEKWKGFWDCTVTGRRPDAPAEPMPQPPARMKSRRRVLFRMVDQKVGGSFGRTNMAVSIESRPSGASTSNQSDTAPGELNTCSIPRRGAMSQCR